MTVSLSLLSDTPLSDMLERAQALVNSKIIPASYDKPEKVLAACSMGQELGFSPMQSLRLFTVIQGVATLSAAGIQALCVKHGAVIATVEHDDKHCTLSIVRDGVSHLESYSLLDAQRQGLLSKDNWAKMPKQMLYARCVSTGLRKVFPDVISGLYSTEEMSDVESKAQSEVVVTPASRSAPRKEKAPASAPEPTPVQAPVERRDTVKEPDTVVVPARVIPDVIEVQVVEVTPEVEPVSSNQPIAPLELLDASNSGHLKALKAAYVTVTGNTPADDFLLKAAKYGMAAQWPVDQLEKCLRERLKEKVCN